LLSPAGGFAAGGQAPSPNQPGQGAGAQPVAQTESHGWFGKMTFPYKTKRIPPPNMANSGRLEALLRAGNMYLSLQDCIALALENNLDIQIQRYGPLLADAAVLLASAGGAARGVSTSITAGPSSSSVSSTGTTGSSTSAAAGTSAGSSTAVGASVIQSSGPVIPSLDPMLVGSSNWSHLTTPQSSAFTTGTNFLINSQNTNSAAIQKSFLSGTIVSLGLSNSTVTNNSVRADFNPATNASLSFSFTQHLLQGFGWGVNSRQIRIAKNNREVADLTVELQVVTTVAAVMELYWDLVAFNDAVRVAQDALAASQQLLEDNKKQVAVGTLAQIEVVRAEAQIATGQQSLLAAQLRVEQQETIIKTALSKTGVASLAVAEAHIIPTDSIQMPGVEPVIPIQDLTAQALSARPELTQSRVQLVNQALTVKGSKNGLLPTLDVVGNVANNALAGQVNLLPAPAGSAHSNTPFFIGGYSTVLSQLFARNFPNYAAGFNLTIPIRNRTAQAQEATDELTYRQQELALQRQENQVRVDVRNSLIGLQNARAQYEAAGKAVTLQQQTLDAEQKKLELGASTIYNVILDQRDLVTAESNQVAAAAAYAKARVELDRATGQLLNNNDISLDEAMTGVVSRPPSPIPPPR
jgi:outer membrane protein TolC